MSEETEFPEELEGPEPTEEEQKKKAKKEKDEEDEQEKLIMGKYLLRDIPLFKYEIFLYFGIGMAAFMLYILERTELVPGALDRAIIPAILIPVAVWFVKWKFYMPSKNRVPSMKIYKSGVVELGLTDIKKGYVIYGQGDNKKRKFITKLTKHTEASTGKPFLVTSELRGENINLLEDAKPDMRSDEFNAILETEAAVTTKLVMNKMLKSIQPSLSNPMFLISMITLFMVAALLMQNFGVMNFLRGG